MSSPLNPTLYNALRSKFGDVQINSPGIAISWVVHRSAIFVSDEARPSRKVFNQGEEYLVRCPFCKDWKKRLSINHRWGVLDRETNSQNLWLCQCYNEQCTTDWGRQMQLFTTVYGQRRQVTTPILPGVEVDPFDLEEVEPPGEMIRLDELAASDPRHPAIEYLESRQFDPAKIGRLYDASYCEHSQFTLARNRIIIPVKERGILYGWQARHIGDRVGSQTLKDLGIPKYWTMPGMKRKILGYNMDTAVRHQTIAVVEGPMDVWGFGPQAFGLLGKTMNAELARKLGRWLDLYWGEQATILVILDPDQDETSARRHDKHHIEKCVDVLRDNLRTRHRDRILPIYLPVGTDPGSLDRAFMRRLIQEKAAERRLSVSFSKDGRKPAVANERLLPGEIKHASDRLRDMMRIA